MPKYGHFEFDFVGLCQNMDILTLPKNTLVPKCGYFDFAFVGLCQNMDILTLTLLALSSFLCSAILRPYNPALYEGEKIINYSQSANIRYLCKLANN